MTKKIAVINDLSGFGRCSLTAAISVLSAMGVQACPLPTAVLSAQTGYPSYYCDDYTEKMEHFRNEWSKMHVSFDGIYTGFVAGERQIDQIQRFIDTFYHNNTFLLVDPVMGDNGRTYSIFSEALCQKMRALAKQADIITPNLTELCLLTDTPYRDILSIESSESLVNTIHQIASSFCINGPEAIIVTGIQHTSHNGKNLMGNYYITKDSCGLSSFPYIGGSYSGTGDLFASCIAAGIARGDEIPDLIEKAGTFLKEALKDSVWEQVSRNEGVNYEKYLSLLM